MQVFEKGRHSIDFNTEHFAKGIYFLHLITQEKSKVQKLILIK